MEEAENILEQITDLTGVEVCQETDNIEENLTEVAVGQGQTLEQVQRGTGWCVKYVAKYDHFVKDSSNMRTEDIGQTEEM